MNVIEIIDRLLQDQPEELTPYAIAMLINDTFLELGSDKAVTPQMMYRYASQGMITKGEAKKRYSHVEGAVFVLRYVHRHIDK